MTPTVPFAATPSVAVNACWSPAGMFVGVWLIFTGGDHVAPPSVDCEKKIESIPFRLSSSQAA